MKSLSYWAKAHPVRARWWITIAHCILFPLAFILGFLLWLDDFAYSDIVHDISTSLFLLGLVGYPLIRGGGAVLWRYSYQRHKAFDFILVFAGFLSLASLTSMKLEQTPLYSFEGRAIKTATRTAVGIESNSHYLKENTNWHSLKKNARKLKKELRAARKIAKKDGGKVAARLLGTLLVLLLALGLGYLIVAWSCNLACSGQEGAANAVLIGGGALLILLTVLGIRAIWKQRKKPDAPKLE